ncbi:MAG: hypothetical protein ACOCYP_03605 [Planctomycetota bacterium]
MPPASLPLLALALCLSLPAALSAAEVEAPANDDQQYGWDHDGRVGLFLNSILIDNAEQSRDPSITSSEQTVAWTAAFDGALDWTAPYQALEQTLELKFGQQKQDDQAWFESNDLIEYDGVYKALFQRPRYVYGAWSATSVFTGPEPREDPFDPLLVAASAGYGEQHSSREQIEEEPRWSLDLRLGVRAQRRFSPNADSRDLEWEFGPEGLVSFQARPHTTVGYELRYEVFSEFGDLGHVTHLFTASATIAVATYVDIDLDLRAYYEGEPEDAPADAGGYDEIAVRQETLIGIVYSF